MWKESLPGTVRVQPDKSLVPGKPVPAKPGNYNLARKLKKRLIARRRRPTTIFSGNGRTFVGAAHWLKEIQKDEQLQAYLAEEQITWRFNLSRAPWWGGQFERLVGVFKRAFYKTIGGGMLSWIELCEVVLDRGGDST